MTDVPIFREHPQGVQTISRPGAYALMTNADGEGALVKHQGKHHLPGGGSEPGESLEISLARELREEFSWQIPVD
ncbi:MAG: NUDIX domain-containing protein [Dehalococcoidia bacterium]|jgi:ADP-ribose pyrophosphatase YjhB (NUDIX family)